LSKEKYNFSNSIKKEAHRRSKGFNNDQQKDIHHIVAKSIAKKFNLPKEIIASQTNAIALEKDSFHKDIHGGFSNEFYKGFEEEDYIFLAIALLGIDESYFK